MWKRILVSVHLSYVLFFLINLIIHKEYLISANRQLHKWGPQRAQQHTPRALRNGNDHGS